MKSHYKTSFLLFFPSRLSCGILLSLTKTVRLYAVTPSNCNIALNPKKYRQLETDTLVLTHFKTQAIIHL